VQADRRRLPAATEQFSDDLVVVQRLLDRRRLWKLRQFPGRAGRDLAAVLDDRRTCRLPRLVGTGRHAVRWSSKVVRMGILRKREPGLRAGAGGLMIGAGERLRTVAEDLESDGDTKIGRQGFHHDRRALPPQAARIRTDPLRECLSIQSAGMTLPNRTVLLTAMLGDGVSA